MLQGTFPGPEYWFVVMHPANHKRMRPKSRVQHKTAGPQDKFQSLVGLAFSRLPTPLCNLNLHNMEAPLWSS